MTEAVKEGTIRVVEWMFDYDAGPLILSNNFRWRLEQYLGGRWVEIPAFHLDRDGNLREGRLYPMEARQ
jgi:hypothetical protein